MPKDYDFPTRGEELLQQYLSDELASEDAPELLEILKANDHFVDMAFENIQAEILIRQIVANQNTIDLLIETDLFKNILEQEEQEKKRAFAQASTIKAKAPKESRLSAWTAGVMLVGFLLLAVCLEFYPNRSEEKLPFVPLAEIVESVEAVWESGSAFKKGRDIGLGKLNLLDGIVQLRLKNNVEIVLEGPTEFVLRGGDETFCRAGKISVTVPPEGKGFKVATPVATVVDFGTKFSLAVDDEKIDVHVIQGGVDVARSGSDKLSLTTGLAAMLDFKGKTKQFEAESISFLSSETVRKFWNDYIDRRRPVWEEEKRRRSEDPSLLATLDDAEMHGCRRVEGIHPDRHAVQLNSTGDRLRVSLPGEQRHLTILAVVRIKETKNYNAVLCVGDRFPSEPGEFIWQLDRFGNLLFHVIETKEIRRFEAADAVKRSDWKTWTQLGVVVDAERGEVRQYVDGRRIDTQAWKDPIPLRMEQGTVGNYHLNDRNRNARFWSGEIDSFDMFSRAFSDEEIATHYGNLQ